MTVLVAVSVGVLVWSIVLVGVAVPFGVLVTVGVNDIVGVLVGVGVGVGVNTKHWLHCVYEVICKIEYWQHSQDPEDITVTHSVIAVLTLFNTNKFWFGHVDPYSKSPATNMLSL